jgi:hypothetical protein
VFARFFDPETKAFAQYPCFVVVVLPSTCLDGPALSQTSYAVWGDDKLMHLSGLPFTDMGDDQLRAVCSMVRVECISGLYPVPIREEVIRIPLVWCMNGDVVFLVGSAKNKTLADNEITGWIGLQSRPSPDCRGNEIPFHVLPRPHRVT